MGGKFGCVRLALGGVEVEKDSVDDSKSPFVFPLDCCSAAGLLLAQLISLETIFRRKQQRID